MPTPSIYAVDFANRVNEKWTKEFQENPKPYVTLEDLETLVVSPGRVYDRIELARDGKAFSVFAFVCTKTGDLIKPATYSAPQKNPRTKELAVRYRLADMDDFAKAVNHATPNGGFLYEDYRRQANLGPLPDVPKV